MGSSQTDIERELLVERARLLARRLDDRAVDVGEEMLTFSLARERFALPSRYVFAVFALAELVPLPGATPPVVGLTRWRGDILTLLDLRRLVASVAGALDDLGRVIVVGDSAPEFGILADVVSEIVSIDPASLHALPDERRGESRLLLGITNDAVHVLDVLALLSRQADVHTVVESAPPSSTSGQ
jgi:purine-binding chemotaxis protein CheW